MTLSLGDLLMALVLVSELVGLVVLARYKVSTETYPPAQEGSITVVAAQEGDGNYQWVVWEDSSCTVLDAQREVESGVRSSSQSEGGVIGEDEDYRRVHVRPYLATTRQPGVRQTSGHHPESASENVTSSRHLGE